MPSVAVPVTAKVTVVGMLTGLVSVTVNNPSTGPASLAWVVAAMLTPEASSSAIVTVAAAGVPTVTAVFCA